MELAKIVDKLGLKVAAGAAGLTRDASSGYVSDLLSDVMAKTGAGTLWITIQTHANVVAVCTLNDLAGVVITGGKDPADDTLAKANEEKVPILTYDGTAYDLVGQLHKLGIPGFHQG